MVDIPVMIARSVKLVMLSDDEIVLSKQKILRIKTCIFRNVKGSIFAMAIVNAFQKSKVG